MMMRSVVTLAAVMPVLALSAANEQAGQMIITRDGQPVAVIVVPDAAGRAETFASLELRKYLEKISGAHLEIVLEGRADADGEPRPDASRILVGKTHAAAALRTTLRQRDADAFVVKIERSGAGHDVFLAGAGERGTIYAAYDFLECELGCRWLAPDERWEEIPQRATVTVSPGMRIEEPALRYRQDNSLDHSDWGLKHKANVCRRIFWPFKWMDERYHDAKPLPCELRGWEAVHDGPRIVRGVSGDNPEWFALDGTGDRPMAQLCFSNPEVCDLLAERLSQLLRERPELDFVEFGCADGLPRNHCRCKRCLEWDALDSSSRGVRGVRTHPWLRLVNAVAKRLAESDPGKKLVAAAYSSYQEPPDPAVVKPAENVIVMYWTWSNCRVHGYEHAVEDDKRLPEMESHERSRRWIAAWHSVTPAGMIMSEYVSRSSMDGIVGANPRRYIHDMRYLRQRGFVGYNVFDGPIPWGMQTVNRYAIAKARWNPDLDPDALVRDFCDHAFHAGSAHMQEFIGTVEDAMQTAGCSHVAATSWVTPEVAARARRCLTAAKAATNGDDIAGARLREFEWHLRYAELAGPAFELWFRGVKGERNPDLMREAIRLGEAALGYRKEMQEKYPNERFRTCWRMRQQVGRNGRWYRLLEDLEAGRD